MTSSNARLDKSKSELTRNIIAAASTTAFCVSLLNPLDVLRIKWQTRPKSDSRSMWIFARDVTREGGGIWRGLYKPGLGVNAASVSCSSGCRLGLYPVTKDTVSFLLAHNEAHDTKPFVMFLSGFISGAIGFFIATPFFTAKIQSQSYNASSNQSGWSYLVRTFRTGHPFSGSSILVGRGALFSAGFSAGYDGTKTKLRQSGIQETPAVHALASIVAAFLATAAAAPFDATLTQYQASRTISTSGGSPLHCMLQMYQEGGVRIFFKGWSLFFARVAPLFLIQLPMYEQARKLLGMDFMK